jgi:nicotinamidase-related amidase
VNAAPGRPEPWLVVIDMQRIFGEQQSAWFTPRFEEAAAGVERLAPWFGQRVVHTRFVAPARPENAWVPYYDLWPFALVAADDPLYDLIPSSSIDGHPVVSATTFGKWGPELDRAIGGSREIVLAGVSTDCCVLSTALAAADAGVHVRVAADACAGLSDADHQRALDAMALYAPLIEITDVAAVVGSLAEASA